MKWFKRKIFDYYLAGGMTGYPEFNHPAFHLATKLLRNRGYSVWSPAEENDTHLSFNICMKKDLNAVVNLCNGIVLLKGWRMSLGANMETFVAFGCGKPVRELIISKSNETKDGYELSFNIPDLKKYQLPYENFASRYLFP